MIDDLSTYIERIKSGDYLALARAISIVENDHVFAEGLLLLLEPNRATPVIGITGPPGAGKSTLVNALADSFSTLGKKVAILAIDPSSPFNRGSLLGDRIRMAKQFNDPNIFIRSMASRGALGGLSEKALQVSDVLKTAPFDFIIIETVGVGQSEIDIVGLADMTVVVLVPESGDEIQHVKSGLMEIADVYVVNKADRAGADAFASKLSKMLRQKSVAIPVVKTNAEKAQGIDQLMDVIARFKESNELSVNLLTEQAWRMIQHKRMKDIDRKLLERRIASESEGQSFNLYRFIDRHYSC